MSKIKRMWVNQPSSNQVYHHLHGANVLAVFNASAVFCDIYFVTGKVIVQAIQFSALSKGWSNEH